MNGFFFYVCKVIDGWVERRVRDRGWVASSQEHLFRVSRRIEDCHDIEGCNALL